MTSRMVPSRHIATIICLGTVLALLVLAGGCTQQQAPAPVVETTITVTDTPTVAPTPPDIIRVSKTDDSHILVTYIGGASVPLTEIDATVTDDRGRTSTQHLGDKLGTSSITIGSEIPFTGSYTGRNSVSVSGFFSDGSSRNILETEV